MQLDQHREKQTKSINKIKLDVNFKMSLSSIYTVYYISAIFSVRNVNSNGSICHSNS